MSETAASNVKKPRGRPFEPGNNANPAGRPKGSRNKLGEDFLKAMAEDFAEYGKAAIVAVRTDKPDAYLKVIASILPKQAEIKIDNYDHLDDTQLRAALGAAVRDLATLGVDIGAGPGEGAGAVDPQQPAQAVSPLH